MPATKAPAAQPATQRAATSTNVPAGPLPVALSQRLGNQHLQALIRARWLQAKLTVSDPHDVYEQEADRVADQVMRAPEAAPVASLTTTRVQRTGRECEDELHRSATGAESVPTIDAATEQAIRSLSERGSPLPVSVRAAMEPRLGADFSGVRVHDDEQAHDLARSVNAQAFTVGRDVVFGAGHYSPHTAAGKRLLAHELTHVLQQSAVPGGLSRVQRQPAPVAPPQPEATATPSQIAFVRFRKGEAFLDLRAAPDAKSESLARLSFGRRLHTIDDPSPHPGWMKVVAGGKTGYVDATRIHFPPEHLIQQDPGLSLIRVRPNLSFYALVHEQYGIRGDESARDRNMNHFINAIRAVNKLDAFNVKTDFLDDIGNFALSGRDASDTYLKANFDLWIPSFGVAARMDVGSGTVRGEFTRFIRKIDETVADFVEACRLSGAYIPSAVSSRAGEVGAGLLAGLVDFALDAVKILAGSTATGALIGALFGGVGAIPGAEIGFEMGLVVLKYYGLFMLIEAIVQIARGLFEKLGEFVTLAWQANGDKEQLDLAGRALADAIGILVSAILIAVSIYVMKKGSDALAKTKFAEKVGASRLAQWLTDRRQRTTLGNVRAHDARGREEPQPLLPPGREPQHSSANTSPTATYDPAAPREPVTHTMAGVGRPPQRPPRASPPPVPQHSARSPERLFEVLERGVDRALRPATGRGQAPRNVPTGDFRRGMTTADEAYAAYNEALAVSAGREVAVYYNYLTGEYRVRIGTDTKVFGPADDGDWGALVHFHPNAFNALGYRLPAPADFFGLYMRFFRDGRRVREFVETDIPGVGRGRTEFGIEGAPRQPVLYVRFHHPDGRPPTMRKFSGDGEYQRYWSQRAVYVEKGSPEHVEILADLGAGRQSYRGSGTRTQTGGGSRDFDHEDPTPPANPHRQGKVNRPDFDEEADTIVDHPNSAHQSGEIRAPDKPTDRPVTNEPKVIVDREITEPRSSLSGSAEFEMVDEVIGNYFVKGSRTLDGKVLRRRILILQLRHGKTREGGAAADAGRVSPSLRDAIGPIKRFIELLLADAAAAGATRLQIVGMAVQAASVRNIRLAVERYHGTVTRISDTTINIDIPVTAP